MRRGHDARADNNLAEPLLADATREVSPEAFDGLSPQVVDYVDETRSYVRSVRTAVFVATLADAAATAALVGFKKETRYVIATSRDDLEVLSLIGFASAAVVAFFPQRASLAGYWVTVVRLILTIAKAIAFSWSSAEEPAVLSLLLGMLTALISLGLVDRIAVYSPQVQGAVEWLDSHGTKGFLPDTIAPNSGAAEARVENQGLSRVKLASILKPYFWPKGITNKLRCFSTWFLLGLSKACNLFAPIFIGRAVQRLSDGDPAEHVYTEVVLYSSLVLCSKVFNEGQSYIYLGVKQVAFAEIAERSFDHLHSLSLEWHLKKKLGQTMRALDRGIAAADTIMTYLFLYLGPSMVELCVILVVFYKHFKIPALSAIIFCSYCAYSIITIQVTLWRKKFRDATNKQDNKYHDRATDSLINYETVKYFTAEQWESERYVAAVRAYQHYSVAMQGSLALLNSLQQLIIQTCCCASLCLAAYHVGDVRDMQVGAFVSVQVYTLNLFAPLSFLGTIYNAIIQAVVDMQNLSQLLAELPDVVDEPGARELVVPSSGASVEFRDVVFHYPSQPASNGLQGLSFFVAPGTETAFCGPTGAGKSTIFRLLFRFYDPLGGEIRVCDQPTKTLTQQSLRACIGVVPQDTVLFNDTILYNVSYGRREASFEDVVDACKRAQIYDTIMKLPEQFNTVVGERGLKLSGGEKQRVAIARCILKDAPILILDEWSSALDTKTEKIVHGAIQSLSKSRTTLIIAHRLSTVRHCQQILVLMQGRVVERGTHDDLVSRLDSVYSKMWTAQQSDHATTTDGSGGAIVLNGDDGSAVTGGSSRSTGDKPKA